MKTKFSVKNIFRNQIFIPIAAMLLLLIFNLILDPSFFKITLGYNSAGNPVLSGYLIIILVDSSHDIELDQACSLHFLIIKTALGSIYKIGYENSPGSVFSGKLTLILF